ncbi:M48 family metallopeptidase [Candidatus Berkelbacteria bacterium]|nr:M48 family metallopeptidase [Candidatus Berkelbacteria bacterium]
MYREIGANKFKSVILLGCFLILVILLGWGLSWYYESPVILYFAVGISLIQAWVGYFYSDQVALAISGAKEAPRKEPYLVLHREVENLAITAGLVKPRVYVINDPAPNAFATGRDSNHAAIAVTTGLLEQLDKTELEGVLAHELSHIGNYDIRLMSLVVVLVGMISLFADFFLRSLWWGGERRNRESGGDQFKLIALLVAAILAPLAATLIQLAISRRREFLADATGSLMTRYPEGLASALQKIATSPHRLARLSSATSHLYIENPLTEEEEQSFFVKIFSTHPPVKDRIKRLRAMINKSR